MCPSRIYFSFFFSSGAYKGQLNCCEHTKRTITCKMLPFSFLCRIKIIMQTESALDFAPLCCTRNDRLARSRMHPCSKLQSAHDTICPLERKMLEENAFTHAHVHTNTGRSTSPTTIKLRQSKRVNRDMENLFCYNFFFLHRIPCRERFCRHSIWFVDVFVSCAVFRIDLLCKFN